jgi:tetratricopeptide (TPR) repeat protein
MNLDLSGLFSGGGKKKLAKKIAQYRDRLNKDPYNPTLHVELGDLLVKLDQPQTAIEHYHQAANLLTQQHNPSKISSYLIEIYKKILSLVPDDRACENLGAEYNRIGKHTKAYELYLSVAEKLYQQGFYERALRLYQSALILVYNSAIAHTRCAEIYQHLGQLEKSAFEYFTLGELSSKRQKPAEALEYYQKALNLLPSNLDIRAKMAETYQQLGKREEALKEYLNLAKICLEKEEAAKALTYYQRCLTIYPDHPQALEGKKKAIELYTPTWEREKSSEPQPAGSPKNLSGSQGEDGLSPQAETLSPNSNQAPEMEESLDLYAPLTFPPVEEKEAKATRNISSRSEDNPTEEFSKVQALIQEKELLEAEVKEHLRNQELLKEKMEKILESKRRLQQEFQEQLSQLEEERNNLVGKSRRVAESEAYSINDLKSLQDKIRILQEKLSQAGYEKTEIQQKFSRQIEELKLKEKSLKAELSQIAREKKELEEKLEALTVTYQELQEAKRVSEEQFKEAMAKLQANQQELQDQLNALLKEKIIANQKLKLQGDKLKVAAKLLKEKLDQVNELKRQLELRLNKWDKKGGQSQEELVTEIARLTEEKTQLQNRLQAIIDAKEHIEREFATLKNELNSLQQTKKKDHLKFTELARRHIQRGKALVRLDQERKKLAQQLADEVAQKRRIAQELEQVKQAEQQLQKTIWEKLESEKALKEELTRFQTRGANLSKQLEEHQKKEAELEAQLAELLVKGREVDALRNQLNEHLRKEEELNQKLNSIQVQYKQTEAQMLEEKAQLMERVQQLQAEMDQTKTLSAQQLAQIKAELEERTRKEKLLIGKLKQLVKAKAATDKSLSEETRKKLALYEKQISALQTDLEESRIKNRQLQEEIQILERNYKKELASRQKEIEELKKLRTSSPAMITDGIVQRLEKKLEEIQEADRKMEALLKEARILEEEKNLQLKKGLTQVLAGIERLERDFRERISSLEDKSLQTETWLKEILNPQSLKTFLKQELGSTVTSDENRSAKWLRGIRLLSVCVIILLTVLFLLRHMSYNEELSIRLDNLDPIVLQSENAVAEPSGLIPSSFPAIEPGTDFSKHKTSSATLNKKGSPSRTSNKSQSLPATSKFNDGVNIDKQPVESPSPDPELKTAQIENKPEVNLLPRKREKNLKKEAYRSEFYGERKRVKLSVQSPEPPQPDSQWISMNSESETSDRISLPSDLNPYSEMDIPSRGPDYSQLRAYRTYLLHYRNQNPQTFIRYNPLENLYHYEFYPFEGRGFRRPERPFRFPDFRGPVRYQGGYRPERPFR